MSDIVQLLGDAGQRFPGIAANRFASHNFSSSDGTNSTIMLSGVSYYICTYFRCQIDPTTTVSGGGMVTVVWTDSVDGVIGNLRFFAPNAVGNPSNVTTTLQFGNEPNFFLTNSTPGSTLKVNLDTALTGGQVRMIFRYILTDKRF